MKILITGTTGYIGNRLAIAAATKGYDVNALVRNLSSQNLPHHPNIHFFKGDITDPASITPAIKDCHFVFHAAALTQLWNKDRSVFYKVNVDGTRNMLEAALKAAVRKFVFTSSCAVLGPSNGHPVSEDEPRITPFENDYEISKHCAEELVKEYAHKGLFALTVCPPRVYGPGLNTKGNAVNRLLGNAIKSGIAFMPSTSDALGNYAFIDDVIDGYFLANYKGARGEKYILGGENKSYKEFFTVVQNQSDKKINVFIVPDFLLKSISMLIFSAHYLIGRHTHISPKTINRISQNRSLNCNKAIEQLGYRITPFAEGIRQTINHLKTKHA